MDHWSALKVMASSKTQCVSITFWKRAAQALMQRRRRFDSCSIQSRVVSLKSSTQMFQRTSLTTIRTSCKQFWQQIITVTLQFTLFFAQRFLVPAVVVCDVQRRLLLLRLPMFFFVFHCLCHTIIWGVLTYVWLSFDGSLQGSWGFCSSRQGMTLSLQ
jgi:hypothetical protein